MTGTPGRDYTIEVWSQGRIMFAECTCGKWYFASEWTSVLTRYVNKHKAKHTANGDYVEVV
jgi:hypothetical protein